MVGGELAFDWRLAIDRTTYVRFARGYKAGGFNVSLAGVDFGTSTTAVSRLRTSSSTPST
jgi:hypothetical protein